MAINYEDKLGFAQPTDGDQAWGDDIRGNYDLLGHVLAPDNCYFVAPNFSTANITNNASDRRHFDTIQGAIDAYESNVGVENYGAIFIYPGLYTEQLTVTKTVALIGMSPSPWASAAGRKVTLQNDSAGPVITLDPIASTDCSVTVANLNVVNFQESGSTISDPLWVASTDQGATNYGTFGNTMRFFNCTFRGEDTASAFTHGFEVAAHVTLGLKDCDVKMPNYGSTENIFRLLGNATKPAKLFAHQSHLIHWAAAGTYTISAQTNTYIQVYDCVIARDRAGSYISDSGGTHSNFGLSSDLQAEQYKNKFGYEVQTF